MLKRLVALALTILCMTAFASCNTIRGLGKDIEKGGEAIQKSTQ
ncbi:MAG: entericidin A/B family lipoprotein [Nitrospirae bacterium]|nr:entericidin A/B family lipoprotein [Nitrospirota bacterium]